MSIWASIDGPEIRALDGGDDAANYRAEGEPTITVDVAFTRAHDHIRLGLWDVAPGRPGFVDVTALLSKEAATVLRDRLTQAINRA